MFSTLVPQEPSLVQALVTARLQASASARVTAFGRISYVSFRRSLAKAYSCALYFLSRPSAATLQRVCLAHGPAGCGSLAIWREALAYISCRLLPTSSLQKLGERYRSSVPSLRLSPWGSTAFRKVGLSAQGLPRLLVSPWRLCPEAPPAVLLAL